MNIFVGNLPFSTQDADLRSLFEAYGEVSSAKVIQDRETQRSRGFGFVEMTNDEEARRAIAELDQTEQDGRQINVNEARPRPAGGGGGGGGPRGPRR